MQSLEFYFSVLEKLEEVSGGCRNSNKLILLFVLVFFLPFLLKIRLLARSKKGNFSP